MRENGDIRRLVWLYFWLLIFEGAFRKWITPGLSTPLLVVRDPVVIAIYLMAGARALMPGGGLVLGTWAIGALSVLISVAGIGNLFVTLFGFRANFLHLPLVLLLPRVFDIRDVRQMMKWLMILSPFMAALAVQQFRAGPDSWWNVGAGGSVGGQIQVTEERVRASGTFSFANGIAAYGAMLASAVLCGFVEPRRYPRWLVWVGLGSLLLTLGVSGSRSAVVNVTLVGLALVYVGLRFPGRFAAVVRVGVLGNLAFFLLAQFSKTFSEGLEIQGDRFEAGGGVKEGILVRFLLGFPEAWIAAGQAPLLGFGLGVGTNAGAGLLSGQAAYLLAESEWSRILLESGPIFGGLYLLLRIGYLGAMWVGASRALSRGSPVPLLLFGAGAIQMFVGQFGQPTALGFGVLIGGLCLAACNDGEEAVPEAPEPARELPRGRAEYAERLRGLAPGAAGEMPEGAR
jgi:hypothetical protein